MPRQSSSATTPPTSLSHDETLSFRFVGGNPGCDLVNTADWTPRGPENDRLTRYERLIEWARSAGVIDDTDAARHLRRASARPAEAAAAFARARTLRWTLRRLLTTLARAGATSPAAQPLLDEFNELVAEAYARLRVGAASGPSGSSGMTWQWAGAPDRLDAVLWPVVRAVAELLTSDDIARIRACAGDDCGWIYVDRSRNGLRRWCEMATCGTRAKSQRRRGRAVA